MVAPVVEPTFSQLYGSYIVAGSFCLTLLTLGWRARAFLSNLVTNHIDHMKKELVEAQQDSARDISAAVHSSAQTIILALKQ